VKKRAIKKRSGSSSVIACASREVHQNALGRDRTDAHWSTATRSSHLTYMI
jgi:hypothetical protein